MKSTENTKKCIRLLRLYPYKIGIAVGFDKLTKLHNEWMVDMINGTEDATLQAHRGSYKTTCVSIVLAILMVLYPNEKLCFIRSSEKDTREIIKQTANILKSEIMSLIVREIYGIDLVIDDTAFRINTNLSSDVRGTWQLVGRGCGSSITGQHYDRIFTDDIVTLNDRISEAAREATKAFYMELQNVKNRDGRIYNTGTPWHKNDCFSIMPPAKKYDCYSTGLIEEDKIKFLKASMSHSLFAANYELRHVASDDVLFDNPQIGASRELAKDGWSHLDAAFYGEDYTAFTILNIHDGKFYVYGRCWRKHVDDVTDEIVFLHNQFLASKMFMELNADKGYVAKQFRNKGLRVSTYSESQNKFVKISTHLKFEWGNVVFVEGTDEKYIEQIIDYTEHAEHDDCPDSLASLIRAVAKKKNRNMEEFEKYLSW